MLLPWLLSILLLVSLTSFSQENTGREIILFPNTASIQINLMLGVDINPTKIAVHDLNGRMVIGVPIENDSFYTIDTSILPQGMYLVVVTTPSETLVKKFLVDPNSINSGSYYNGPIEKVTNKVSFTANINGDEIVLVDTPTRVDSGSTTNVSVTYLASTARDISVLFKSSSSPYTLCQSAVVSVEAGSGTVQVPITVPSDVPVADYSYRYQILLLPTGQQGYNNRLDAAYLGSISVIGDAPPVVSDEIVSVDTPTRVVRGSTTNVSVAYSTDTARDISVLFKSSSSPYTLYQSAVVSVGAGSGAVQIPIAVPSDVPVADYSYRYQILLLPTGQQGWNNRLDVAYVTSISVNDDDPPVVIDDIVSVDTPTRVDRGSTTNVSVTYLASTARDISVLFKSSSSPYTLYQSTVVGVGAGSGTVQIPIVVPSDVPVADYSYRYQILLLPTGRQGWNNRLDAAYVTSISVNDVDDDTTARTECTDANYSYFSCDLDFDIIHNFGTQELLNAQFQNEQAANLRDELWARERRPILRDEINRQLGTEYSSYDEAKNAYVENYVKNIVNVESIANNIQSDFSSNAFQQDKIQESYTKELVALNKWKEDGLNCIVQDNLIVDGFPQEASRECQDLMNTEIRGRKLKSLGAGNPDGTPSSDFISLNNEVLKDFSDAEYEAGLNRSYREGMQNLIIEGNLVNTFARLHNQHIDDQSILGEIDLMVQYLWYTERASYGFSLTNNPKDPFPEFSYYTTVENMGKQNAPLLSDEVKIFQDNFFPNEVDRCNSIDFFEHKVECFNNYNRLVTLKETIIQEHILAGTIFDSGYENASEVVSESIRLLRNGNSQQKTFLTALLNEDIETAMSTMIEGESISCCQIDPSCCDQELFDPLVQLTARIVIDFSDGMFNYFMFMLETETSWSRRGRAVRSFMEDLDIDVPSDIDDRTLGRLFKVRKRNTDIVIEPVGEWKDTVIDAGISILDILAVVSPSKGASAYLFVKGGGTITAKAISDYLKLIVVNASKIDGLITKLGSNAKFVLDGTGAFRNVGGHHPLAKIGFSGDRFYNLRDAFSVSINKLGGTAIHNAITQAQRKLYTAFAKTGERLTLEKMAEIEIKAMVEVGIPEDIATGWVIKALQDLKTQGVKTITNIPWNGKN